MQLVSKSFTLILGTSHKQLKRILRVCQVGEQQMHQELAKFPSFSDAMLIPLRSVPLAFWISHAFRREELSLSYRPSLVNKDVDPPICPPDVTIATLMQSTIAYHFPVAAKGGLEFLICDAVCHIARLRRLHAHRLNSGLSHRPSVAV